MCLLIFKPESATVPASYLHAAHRANRDGAGIAYHTGRRVAVEKSPRWNGFDVERALKRIGSAPAIIHFRLATHGSVTRDNAHPFPLPFGYAAAHNGVINGLECLPDESDTRAFLRVHVSPYLDESGEIPPSLVSLWEKEIGSANKVALMSPGGEVTLVNAKSGTWLDGVWYSNTYSLPFDAFPSFFTRSRESREPSLLQWHREPSCSYCCHPVDSRDGVGFGTLDNGELICDGCADLF